MDQKLISHDNASVSGSGANYGANIPLKSLPIIEDMMKVKVFVKTGFSSGTITINLCGSDADTETPTDITQPIYSGPASGLPAGKRLSVGINPGSLKKNNRINVQNSASNAGAEVTTWLEPTLK